jgi:anti-anti-sigma factor
MLSVKDDKIIDVTFTESDLSIKNASALYPLLVDAAALNNKDIQLDLINVDFVDSSAIAMLVKFVQHISGVNRVVTLKNVAPGIVATFRMINLSKFFNIVPLSNNKD